MKGLLQLHAVNRKFDRIITENASSLRKSKDEFWIQAGLFGSSLRGERRPEALRFNEQSVKLCLQPGKKQIAQPLLSGCSLTIVFRGQLEARRTPVFIFHVPEEAISRAKVLERLLSILGLHFKPHSLASNRGFTGVIAAMKTFRSSLKQLRWTAHENDVLDEAELLSVLGKTRIDDMSLTVRHNFSRAFFLNSRVRHVRSFTAPCCHERMYEADLDDEAMKKLH